MILGAIVAGWAVLVALRLLYLQVVCHGDYVRLARQQQTKMEEITAPRGAILDRNGQPLAMTVPVQSVCVNPLRVGDKAAAATVFSHILGVDREKLLADLTTAAEAKRGFLWVKRRVSREQVARLKSLPFDWIEYRDDHSRQYPNGKTGAHIIGGVNFEEKGNGGIELGMDEVLRGRPGLQRMLTDSRRRGFDSEIIEQPQAGTSLRLTVDSRIQFVAERYLAEAVTENHCWTGSLVVMDPQTGEIYAMANYPTFDPADSPDNEAEVKARLNLSISAPFEPGSVFKVITLTAALETTYLRPDTILNCGNGRITLFSRVIRDAHAYSALSLADVLAKSSNVGAIRAGLAVGEERLYEYVRKFGFGTPTGLPLPAEAGGRVYPLKRWQATSIGSVSMGHEVMTTNLQLARAAAVVANGGKLVHPKIILARRKSGGPEVPEPSEQQVQVIKPETAVTMTSMMEGVVLHGTGRRAQPQGYSAAGKTGSAQIYDPAIRHYTSRYNASFMGFTPVHNPRLVICVTLNGATRYGGTVSAPVFKRVAEEALRILDVRKDLPETLPEDKEKEEPDDSKLAMNDLPPAFDEDEQEPTLMQPAAVVKETGDQAEVRYLDGPKVPDFTGKTLRRVLEESSAAGLALESVGSGIARAQFPPPGTVLPPGERVRVQFAR